MEIDEVIFGCRVEYSREEAGKAQRAANPIAFVQVTLEHLTASHQALRKVCVFAILSTKAKNHRVAVGWIAAAPWYLHSWQHSTD